MSEEYDDYDEEEEEIIQPRNVHRMGINQPDNEHILIHSGDAEKVSCARRILNWADPQIKYSQMFDHELYFNSKKEFSDPEKLNVFSPKLTALLQHIKKLDEHDMANYKHHFKHYIFSNVAGRHGARLIASGLQGGLGCLPVMHPTSERKVVVLKDNEQHKKDYYGLLTPENIYGLPYEHNYLSKLVDKFNAPNNHYGEHMRFIVLNRQYKEGIGLFDVKYIHLFEPLDTMSQQRQAIARAIRFCKHIGLPYKPNVGWKVKVFQYEMFTPLDVPLTFEGKTLFNQSVDGFLRDMTTSDSKKYTDSFIDYLEAVAPLLAFDFYITEKFHRRQKHSNNALDAKVKLCYTEAEVPHSNCTVNPTSVCNNSKFRVAQEVAAKYPDSILSAPPLQNMCKPQSELTKFQRFVAEYLGDNAKTHGILLWHSPGSGKTCTAINTVKELIRKGGYHPKKVMWATRRSLGGASHKNSCETKDFRLSIAHESQQKAHQHESNYNERYIGKLHTYRNVATALNEMRNYDGRILVVDEAHLMVTNELSNAESMPPESIAKMRTAFENAWRSESTHPLRVIFLTGTPVGEMPQPFFKLMNLIRSPTLDPLPVTLPAIKARYGAEVGVFSFDHLLQDLQGYISYLNMSDDKSQFAFHDEPIQIKVYMSHKGSFEGNKQLMALNEASKKSLTKLMTQLKGVHAKYKEYQRDGSKLDNFKKVMESGDAGFLAKYDHYVKSAEALTGYRKGYLGRERTYKASQETILQKHCGFAIDSAKPPAVTDPLLINPAGGGRSTHRKRFSRGKKNKTKRYGKVYRRVQSRRQFRIRDEFP